MNSVVAHLKFDAVLQTGSNSDFDSPCVTQPTISDGLALAGRVILSVLSLLVILFWLKNVFKYYEEIKIYWTIKIFYLFAMISIIVSLWLAWKPICELNSKHW